jgi:precorrin-2 dehydrogenase / sirohydrochlorin ferrochelatase
MLPITLDLAQIPIALVGNGAQALRRLTLLDEAGAQQFRVYAPSAQPDLARRAGRRLLRRWPTPQEVASVRLLLIADHVEPGIERDLVATARAARTLVNVEDKPAYSDFHSPALLRRGDLTIAISTAGQSPALAQRLRGFLAAIFGPEWQHILDGLAQLRSHWREGGAAAADIKVWTDTWLDHHEEVPFAFARSMEGEAGAARRPVTETDEGNRGGRHVAQAW